MKSKILTILFFIGLAGCTMPTELKISDNAKDADKFSRAFIDKVLVGKIEDAKNDIDSDVINDNAIEFITNASRNLNPSLVKNYKVIEQNWTKGITENTGQTTTYRLGYEYELDRGYVLFRLTTKEEDGEFSVLSFNGELIPAPLEELTKFTFDNKGFIQYLFLLFMVLVPLFILTTVIIMLLSKMTVKKKVVWALIILFVSLPRFMINWNSGAMDFNIFNISLLGSGFSRPALYSAWILSFNVPIGAILFLIKRKSLLRDKQENKKNNSETVIIEEEIKNAGNSTL